jgi:predicted GNAT family N-acyltransferase
MSAAMGRALGFVTLESYMAADRTFRVRIVEWGDAGARLSDVRTAVFVDEQQVPVDVERDGRDAACVHVLAESGDGAAVGAGRLMPDGRIGRMAVLRDWRGSGVGGAMLQALMAEARRRGHRGTHLHSQAHAKAFYERHGYIVDGEEYFEAGLPHVLMREK